MGPRYDKLPMSQQRFETYKEVVYNMDQAMAEMNLWPWFIKWSSASSSSQVVHVAEEVLVVVESLEVNVLGLDSSTVEKIVEFSDLVSVLARSWNLDRSGPVGVHVAEAISEILESLSWDISWLVHTDVVVNWSHTTLSGLLRYQVEVELLGTIVVLDQLGVDDTTWLRIISLSVSPSNKHSLVDSFVDNY